MAKKKVVIAANMPRENGGSLLPILLNRGFDVEIVKAYKGEPIPSPQFFDALIVMGGLMSARSNKGHIVKELQSIRKAIDAHKPYFGICLGLQALVKVAGGSIVRSSRKEIGFRDSYSSFAGKPFGIRLTNEGKKDPLFKDINKDEISPIFQLHRATVKLSSSMNPHAVVLATDRDGFVPNQVIRVGKNAYGVQGHRELTREVFLLWLRQYASIGHYSTEMKWEMIREYDRYEAEYSKVSNTMFQNFCDLV